MAVLGIVLILVALGLVVPRGGIPGSTAVRNIDMGMQGVHETPGYQESEGSSRRWSIIRIAIGLAIGAGGVVCIALAGG